MGLVVILHLGVIDIPYVEQKPAKPAPGKASPAHTTTGKVAAILEGNYSVMGHFFELHSTDIAELMAISVSETLEALVMGAPATIDPFGAAMSETEQLFRTYLDDEEIAQTGQEGVPTGAAQAGVSSRFKSGGGPVRPSFIDTGLYQSSFKAWIE